MPLAHSGNVSRAATAMAASTAYSDGAARIPPGRASAVAVIGAPGGRDGQAGPADRGDSSADADAAEEAARPREEDHGHDREDQREREFLEERLAERVRRADEAGARGSARERAEPS